MTYRIQTNIVKPSHQWYNEIDFLSYLSKNLYNSTLYYERQAYFNTKRFRFYQDMNREFTHSNQVDYRALPAKVSKQTQRAVDQAIKSYLKLKKNPDRYNQARLPRYLHKTKGRFPVFYEKGALSFIKQGVIKLSKTSIEVPCKLDKSVVQQVRLVPCTGYYKIEIVYKKKINPRKRLGKPERFASIDLGINNLATVTSNVFSPVIINGRPLKSINQYSNKEIAKAQALLPKDVYTSKRIAFLYGKRYLKIQDYLHKAGKQLVNYLVSQTIDLLIIGKNQGWKQNTNLSNVTNQKFVQIPHNRFTQILEYLCKEQGIDVVYQEESYTSKASFLDNDEIPVYGELEETPLFSGKRIYRGLYQTSDGYLINADVNGSYNIMKKYLETNAAWDEQIRSNCVEVCSTPRVMSVLY